MAVRGEIWWIKLDPAVGHEIRKTRPCVIVSPDAMNRSGTSIVVPLTGGGAHRRFRIPASVQDRPGSAAVDQVRTIDRARLGRRIGEADPRLLRDILSVLREMFEE